MALARGASSKDKLKAGLVGCGGRGTQAVVNLLTGNENVELVAMADVFEDHLESSLNRLRTNGKYVSRDAGITVERNGKPVQMSAEDLVASIQPRIKVDPEHHFVGFDAFQNLINSNVDIVMLATPPGYRPQHFEALQPAGIHQRQRQQTETVVGRVRQVYSFDVDHQNRRGAAGGFHLRHLRPP